MPSSSSCSLNLSHWSQYSNKHFPLTPFSVHRVDAKPPAPCTVLGTAGTICGSQEQCRKGLSYRTAKLRRLTKSIPWNRFLDSLKVLKRPSLDSSPHFSVLLHCKKGYRFSQPPPGMALTKLSLVGKYLNIPAHKEFGQCHPGLGRENRQPFFTVQARKQKYRRLLC